MKSKFLSTGHKANFETLSRAAKNNAIALMECTMKDTGGKAAVICAVNFDGREYEFVPIATMFNENPYDVVESPA